ncbi:MAG: 3-deoxy-D-manno-octulosonic acid transferase, partial [Betaproteobacteria bacterium]|nr:3-deoxy-D-manno-octulosonic acid transferase [Betaproteobacteria bacterium]
MIRTRPAYTLLLYLLLPFVLLRLWWRGRKEPGYRRNVAERLGRYGSPPLSNCIWIHAVSVGETRAAQPIVERLLRCYPEKPIVMTHMTPTGRAAGEQVYGDRILRCYLPYDFPGAIRRFLDHFRPSLGLVMETEVWPNTIHACRARGIALYLVNARLSEKSYRGYARVHGLAAEALNELTAIAAQSDSDAERFRALGATNVAVTGNIKFDIAPDSDLVNQGRQWRQTWGTSRPVFLAASTRDGEEALLLDVLDRIETPGLLVVIVPRHPQRFSEVAELLDRRGLAHVRRSSGSSPAAHTRVLLGDSMGEMAAYYAACDVAFIGGSLRPFGAHNLVEACALAKPVLIGPSMFNFQEAAELGMAAGGVIQVPDA